MNYKIKRRLIKGKRFIRTFGYWIVALAMFGYQFNHVQILDERGEVSDLLGCIVSFFSALAWPLTVSTWLFR